MRWERTWPFSPTDLVSVANLQRHLAQLTSCPQAPEPLEVLARLRKPKTLTSPVPVPSLLSVLSGPRLWWAR